MLAWAPAPPEAVAMQSLDVYLDSLRTQDWTRLITCLAENVHRVGPYLDVVQGREAYVAFLAKAVAALPNYDLRVTRVRWLGANAAVVELSELADLRGARREFPEVLLFDFDVAGLIARVDVYIKQPPR